MDYHEWATRYFTQLAHQAGNTVDAHFFRDAIAATGDISTFPPEAIAFILAHAASQGVDLTDHITELAHAQHTAKTEAAAREKAALWLADMVRSAQGDGEPASIIADIAYRAAAFQTEHRERSLFLTLDRYLENRASREYWHDYSPDLFNGVSFPDGTISVIGAAPGSGKSAALINLCRELITTERIPSKTPSPANMAQNRNANRNILFVSAEMTPEAIADRLIHALAWQEVQDASPWNLPTVSHTNQDYWQALTVQYGTPPDYWLFTRDQAARQNLYREVIERYIRPVWGTRFDIAYTRGLRTFDEILNAIRAKAEPGTLVLMDYVQLFPSMRADADGRSPRYLEIRHCMDEAILTAEQTKSVIVCAAQLGREDRALGGANRADDTQGWRESGDIEQTAWNAIKLFMERKHDDTVLSYRVVKARSGGAGDSNILTWIPAYQFMEWTDKKPENKQSKQEKSKKRKYPPKPPGLDMSDEEYEQLMEKRDGWAL